jgi:hypothetical protein
VTTPEEPSTPIPSSAWAPNAAANEAWSTPAPVPVPVPSAPWAPSDTTGPAQPQRTSGFAVTALVLGLTGFCTIVTGILAVIFGNVALGRIARSEGVERGRGMAIAGIVLGWVTIAVLGGIAIAWFSYNLSNG